MRGLRPLLIPFLALLLATSGCGDPLAGVLPATAGSAERRWELRIAPYAAFLRSFESGEVQQVVRNPLGAELRARGPEAARLRTGTDVVLAWRALTPREVTDLRGFLTDPEAFELDVQAPAPTSSPDRVLILRRAETLLKVAIHVAESVIVVNSGQVARSARLRGAARGKSAVTRWGAVHIPR